MCRFINLFLLFLMISSCITFPPIYIYDRATVMENDSAAEWSEFENELHEKLIKEGSKALSQIQKTEKNKEAFQVINGSFSREHSIEKKDQ